VVSLLRHYTEQQAKQGHEVHLLAPPAFPRLDQADQHGWSIIRKHPWTYPSAVRELHQLIRQVDPDVVHLHSFVAGLLGRLPSAQGSARKPVVYQPHAWSFDLYGGRRRMMVERWERSAARRTTRIVANCADEIAEGKAVGIDTPASVLGIAIDSGYFTPPSDEERTAAKASVGFAARPMILVLGRIAFQKAQDLLVAAWERNPVPNTDLVLVGPGRTDALRDIARGTWGHSLHHAVESSDVRRWLWAADVLAIPSRYETVSVVAGEAMATGLPVVATDFNGAARTIVEGDLPRGGQIVPLGDMDALLRACAARIPSADTSRNVDTENGRVRAEHMFDPADVYTRLQEAYEQAACSLSRGDA
jgi:glycosyltransferase involved in cell wall biosynthesis